MCLCWNGTLGPLHSHLSACVWSAAGWSNNLLLASCQPPKSFKIARIVHLYLNLSSCRDGKHPQGIYPIGPLYPKAWDFHRFLADLRTAISLAVETVAIR